MHSHSYERLLFRKDGVGKSCTEALDCLLDGASALSATSVGRVLEAAVRLLNGGRAHRIPSFNSVCPCGGPAQVSLKLGVGDLSILSMSCLADKRLYAHTLKAH